MAQPPTSPRASTVKRLYAFSMNRCAFPGCTTEIVSATGVIVADICHITARSPGGPRYDAAQDPEKRHGFENLVLMCKAHHAEIDAEGNLAEYTVEKLLEIKRVHENEARAFDRLAPELSQAAINGLIIQGVTHEPRVHMDFRHALFKVGGEGGQPLGSGGQGGVLTIVGVAGLPPDLDVDLSGGAGSAPGGGGGGAGSLRFEGRPVTPDDVRGGLRISSLFSANAASFAHGLFNVLGGGCTDYPAPEPGQRLGVRLVLVVECGSAVPNELLRLDIASKSPSGITEELGPVDIEMPIAAGYLVRRVTVIHLIWLSHVETGVYVLRVKTATEDLATYLIEVRASI